MPNPSACFLQYSFMYTYTCIRIYIRPLRRLCACKVWIFFLVRSQKYITKSCIPRNVYARCAVLCRLLAIRPLLCCSALFSQINIVRARMRTQTNIRGHIKYIQMLYYARMTKAEHTQNMCIHIYVEMYLLVTLISKGRRDPYSCVAYDPSTASSSSSPPDKSTEDGRACYMFLSKIKNVIPAVMFEELCMQRKPLNKLVCVLSSALRWKLRRKLELQRE